MIDYFALGLTHALILLALIRLVGDDELDTDPEIEARRVKRKRPGQMEAERERRAMGERDA